MHTFFTCCLPLTHHFFSCLLVHFLLGPSFFNKNGALDSVPNAVWAHKMVVIVMGFHVSVWPLQLMDFHALKSRVIFPSPSCWSITSFPF